MKPVYAEAVKHWHLDQEYVFLNHGSFGACPKIVLEMQSELRKRLESQPLRFMIRELEEMHFEARTVLSQFAGTDVTNLVFIRNATEGVNTILNSLLWNYDDRVLITSQIYPACRNAVHHFAAKNRFTVDEVTIPFPARNKDEILHAVMDDVRADTRLVILDHIASPTGLVFPVKEFAEALKDTYTEILVDGAHAPGAINLNIDELGVQYYTGNCHKWMCSPKGAAFLYVHPEFQESIYPLNVSLINIKSNEFADRFYWQGTYDPTAQLCIPAAIEALEKIAGCGIQKIMQSNKSLNIRAAQYISETLHIPLPYPEDLLACMASFPLPDPDILTEKGEPDVLQEKLYHDFKIEIPVMQLGTTGQRLLRISCHIYNDISQYEYLGMALKNLL